MISGEDSSVIYDPVSRATTESTISIPRSDTFSVFGDGCCGEPLIAQRVSLDFTPKNDDIDNDFVQRKVCSFWEFIRNSPEIQNLKAKPERKAALKPSDTEVSETTKSEPECPKVVDAESTAVAMLEFVEEKGLIDRTFEAKLPISNCSLGSREYKEDEPIKRQKKREKKKIVCPCTTVCVNPCTGALKTAKPTAEYLSTARILSRKMKEWDAEHPKSMEPPGHPPSLQHAIMQRQTY